MPVSVTTQAGIGEFWRGFVLDQPTGVAFALGAHPLYRTRITARGSVPPGYR